MIELQNVGKTFDGKAVLTDVSFQIEPSAFLCITGPSGAGKSTLLHLLVRAITPTSGKIIVDGADLSTFPDSVLQLYRKKIGVLYQDYKLLPHLTAAENIALPLEVVGTPDEDIDALVTDALRRFSIEEQAESFPHELSGGEKTRVALARAVIHNPSILLVDEPTGNIDPTQSISILNALRQIHAQGTTVVVATHDKHVVDTLGVRVVRLENGSIVRDSVGGYEAAPKSTSEESSEEEKVEAVQSTPKSGKSIKPIAI